MWLLLIYVALMIVGDLIDFMIGHFVSVTWTDAISLPVFLACYFTTLWLAWIIAVRVTEKLQLVR